MIRTLARKPRGGYSLVEMLVAMFVLTTFLGLGVALIELMLKLGDGGQRTVETVQVASRLARFLRDDVRAADRVELPAGAAPPYRELTLIGPGALRVRYVVEKGTLVRERRDGDAPGPVERFVLPRPSARFELEPAESPRFVGFVMDRRPGTRRGPSQDFRIEARLSADPATPEALP